MKDQSEKSEMKYLNYIDCGVFDAVLHGTEKEFLEKSRIDAKVFDAVLNGTEKQFLEKGRINIKVFDAVLNGTEKEFLEKGRIDKKVSDAVLNGEEKMFIGALGDVDKTYYPIHKDAPGSNSSLINAEINQTKIEDREGKAQNPGIIDLEVFDVVLNGEEEAFLAKKFQKTSLTGSVTCTEEPKSLAIPTEEFVDGSQESIDLLLDPIVAVTDQRNFVDKNCFSTTDLNQPAGLNQSTALNCHSTGINQSTGSNGSFSQYFDLKDQYEVPSIQDISLSGSIDLFADDDLQNYQSPSQSQIVTVKVDSQDSTFTEVGTKRNSEDTNESFAKPKAKKNKTDSDQITQTQSQSQRPKSCKPKRQKFVQCKSAFREGTWVQCSNLSCQKWRYLKFIQNATEVPETWTCEQNFDPNFADCQIAQDPEYNGLQYVDADFIVGTIKWVKLESFPAWPAMIDDNLDTKTSIWISEEDVANGTETSMTKCHVVFFDSLNGTVTRSWVNISCTKPFIGNETMRRFTSLDDDTYENLRNALASARKASRMGLEQRRRMYCTMYKKKSGKHM